MLFFFFHSSSRSHSHLFLFLRLLSSFPCPSSPSPPKLKNICYRHRSRALADARFALTDYLHSTRSLPFSHAELIASHSPFSLSLLVSQIPFDPSLPLSDFPRALRRFLSYRPINEYDFFFESIGLSPSSLSTSATTSTSTSTPSSSSLFLDPHLLAAVSALVHFGFPWAHLGLLYHGDPAVFRADPDCLLTRLRALESRGLHRACAIAVCLAFPAALVRDADLNSDLDLLLGDITCFFAEFDLKGNNVDAFLQLCQKIRVLYDTGAEVGTMGELMVRNKKIFLKIEKSALAQKLGFFARLGMKREEVGRFVLQNPEILELDLDNPSISMPGYLRHIGLGLDEVAEIAWRYPYVMGKNKLGNLPGSLRAVGLTEWFLCKIVDGNYHLLYADFVSSTSHDAKIESEFLLGMEKARIDKKEPFVDNKLEFLLGIGFGKNKITSRAVALVNSTRYQLQERFDSLLEIGIGYPTLCRMISATPKLLNQSKEMIQEKVYYLCNDLGYSLEYLDSFPAYLCFDLENRIKPRYRILNWLQEHGLLKKPFAPATVLANSEKRFMVNLYNAHPAAPKQWLECFSSRSHRDHYHKNLFTSRPENHC
ncbi:transcription termination factor MTEF18, mitochondrial [Typha latifolia]|uniref:transcription termination factor MTEF18, mitochondrial n=1 Tax=Typha latifolia TaxID=4733 RepID=UPI003C2F6909